MDQETRICQNCKKDFIIESDDFAFYETRTEKRGNNYL